ncbi:hypothetical protein Tco_0546674 [Tanacetum coccineum]
MAIPCGCGVMDCEVFGMLWEVKPKESDSDVPTTEVPTDVPSVGAPTGPSTISPSSTTIPTSSSVPAAAAGSKTTPETPSSPVRDTRKGKGVAIEEPTPTHDKTFKQLQEERLGWEAAQRLQAQELADFKKQRDESLMKDAQLARQMSKDFAMTEDQRKRQQEVLASAANYSDAAWDLILARLQANPDLSSTIFGVEFTDDDFAARMVTLNQGPAVYSTGWTMAQVQKLSPEQLQEEFDKIQRVVAFTWGLKRDGSPMRSASSKKLKTGDNEVNVEAPSHGVPQEEESSTPSRNVSREEVAAPPHSQDIPAAQVKVPSQKATIEDVDAPSNLASTAQHTASSLKKVGTKKKRLGRKGVHTSQSTIPIKEGDPEAEHKVCIKYASDADSASDDDTLVNLYAVVDWELLPTGLGSINAFYRLNNSCKYFTSLREILHLVTRADLMTIYGCMMTFYQDKQAEGLYSFSGVHVLETVSGLVLHMFVDKKYPLSVNLIERMLDHQLEICHGTVGNELTTAVQLIAFLKKQISDSKRPKVHDWYCCYNKEWLVQEGTALGKDFIKSVNGCDDLPKIIRLASPRVNGYLVKASSNPLLFFDSPLPGVNTPWDVMRIVCNPEIDGFDVADSDVYKKVLLLVCMKFPTGRVKVPAVGYVVSYWLEDLSRAGPTTSEVQV